MANDAGCGRSTKQEVSYWFTVSCTCEICPIHCFSQIKAFGFQEFLSLLQFSKFFADERQFIR